MIDYAVVGRFSPDGANIAAPASFFGANPTLVRTNANGRGYELLDVRDEVAAVREIRWRPCDDSDAV